MLRKTLMVGALVTALAGAAVAGAQRYALQVKGLACPFCAYGIEKQLKKLDAVDAVRIDIGQGHVVVTAREGDSLSEAQLKQAVEDAGFTLSGIEELGDQD